MKKSLIPLIFWMLAAVFIFIIGQFFIPFIRDLFIGSELFLAPFGVFCLLGLTLIIAVFKEKKTGSLKFFLLLTGISSAGFFACVLLHNGFYALSIVTSRIIVLKYLMEFLHAAFFLIGVFACPIGFLVGLIGSMALFAKNKK